MKRTGAAFSVLAGVFLLAGCATNGDSPLPAGQEAYEVIPERAASAEQVEIIQMGDRLAIRVFGEPELSGETFTVDSAGYVQVPLLGEVIAAGQTPRALSNELQRRLAARYVRSPSVTVSVIDRPQATFTVEGDVNQPGVYPANSSTTLLSAMAQAKSPTKTAQTGNVLIYRYVNGQRAGGRFDLSAIRRGTTGDPQVLSGDTIVVVNSPAKSAWRDVLAALPLLNTFVLIKNN